MNIELEEQKRHQYSNILALCTAMRLVEDIGRTELGHITLKRLGLKSHETADLLRATASFTDKMVEGLGAEMEAVSHQQTMLVDLFLQISLLTSTHGGEGIKELNLRVTCPNGITKVEVV